MMEPISMGRMSDLWKTAADVVAHPKPLEVVTEEVAADDDWFSGTADVPFIEVGGPAAAPLVPTDATALLPDPSVPHLRVVSTPPPVEMISAPIIASAKGPTLNSRATVGSPDPTVRFNGEPLDDGLFTIRFRPVMAGLVPGRGFGPEMIAYHDGDHPISEQYRLLLAEIALQLPTGPPRVLLFTGATAQAGTTTVVLNLAATIARQGSVRVTVVDANLPRPALGEKLGIANGPGLSDVLTGRTPLPWAVQNTRLSALRALVAGRATNTGSEMAFPPVIDRLRAESDWVLIDAPTWSRPADAVPLADCCDAVYIVARQPDADTAAGFDLQTGFLEATGRLKGCIITQR